MDLKSKVRKHKQNSAADLDLEENGAESLEPEIDPINTTASPISNIQSGSIEKDSLLPKRLDFEFIESVFEKNVDDNLFPATRAIKDHETPQPKKQKLVFYDTLRGISSICVVLHHVKYGFSENLSKEAISFIDGNSVTHWITNGSWHVGLFFMLSGRVLAAGSNIDNRKILANCVKRPFRLAAPMLCALVFASLLYWSRIYNAIGFNTAFTDEVVKVPGWWKYIDYNPPSSLFTHFTATVSAFTIGRNIHYPAGVLWSLPFECWYSYVIYFLSFLLTNLPKRFGQLSLLVFVLHTIYFVQPFIHFVLGFLVCQLQKEGVFTLLNDPSLEDNAYIPLPDDSLASDLSPIRPREVFRFRLLRIVTQRVLQSFLFIFSLILIFTSYFKPFVGRIDAHLSKDRIQGWPWPIEDGFLYTSITMFILFLSLECTPFLQRILSRGGYLGKISFGVYLMHGPLLPLLKVLLAISIRTGLVGWWFTIPLFVYGLFVWVASHLFVKVDQACVNWIGKVYDWCLTL